MSEQVQLQVYEEHPGTVRVSGKTTPKSAAFCAFSYLQRGVNPIDFFYIGGNAGQQAMKAMSIFAHLVERDSDQLGAKFSLAFKPMRFLTVTKDPVTEEVKQKDAAVWRTSLISKE